MSIHIIKVPDIGEGIAEVELVQWHVQPGDSVLEDQVLVEVMTDKATVEVPSPSAGKVLSLGGDVGQFLSVGADLIELDVQADDIDAAVSQGSASATHGGASAQASRMTAPQPLKTEPAVTASSPAAVSAAGSGAEEAATDGTGTDRTNTDKSSTDGISTKEAGHLADEEALGDKPIASPSVRRHAREAGLELSHIVGSGPAGRIMHSDVQAWSAHGRYPTPTSLQDAAAVTQSAGGNRGVSVSPAITGDARYAQRDDETAIPVIGLRRKIAQKMQQSKQHVAHFTYVEEVDMTELEALRVRLNEQWGSERGRLTLLPFLIRAMVLAVRDFPQVNARFDDDAYVLTRYGPVHMGIATQTEEGLMVPVLRHAETHGIWSIAAELVRLAQATRSGKIDREELSGSTITITSLGSLGGIVATPIVNYPEVAIVGINRIVERPMFLGSAVVARKMMNLSSSFDHRIVDGQQAAQFIQKIRGYLECPAMLFVE